MKKVLGAFLLVLVLSAAVFCQQNYFSSTLRSDITKNSLNPQLLLFDTYMFKNSNWGMANFAFAGKGWGKALVGLAYCPSKAFGVTFYLGTETDEWWRLGGDITVNWKKLSWYNYFESNEKSDCWRSILSFAITDYLKTRIESYSSFEGKTLKIGPGLSWSIPATPLIIMPTVLYNSALKKPYLELDVCSNF